MVRIISVSEVVVGYGYDAKIFSSYDPKGVIRLRHPVRCDCSSTGSMFVDTSCTYMKYRMNCMYTIIFSRYM